MIRVALLLLAGFQTIGAEDIMMPSSPGYESIVQPRAESLRGFQNYSPVYSGGNYASPQPYGHVPYFYYGAYNYNMQSYPYMAYYGRGANSPNYPLSRNNERENRSEARFEGARIVGAAAQTDESGQAVVDSGRFTQLWVQAVGMTQMPPPISSREVAAVVVTPSTSNPLVIDKVEKDGDKIKVRLKRETERGFYRSEEERKGYVSAAVFVKGSDEVEFVTPASARRNAERDNVETIEHFLASGSTDLTPKDLSAISSNIRDQGLFVVDVTDEARKSVFSSFETTGSFAETLEELEVGQQNLYFIGRFFESKAQADRLASLAIRSIEAENQNDEIKHVVKYSERSDSDPDFRVNRVDADEIDDVVVRGYYVVTEKPRRMYPRVRFSQISTQTNRVEDL